MTVKGITTTPVISLGVNASKDKVNEKVLRRVKERLLCKRERETPL